MRYEDLPSVKHLSQQIDGFRILFKVNKFLRFFRIGSKKIEEMQNKFNDISKQIDEHKTYSIKFNEYFSSDGWILYDSINFKFVKKVVDTFEKYGKKEAETLLYDYFKPDNIEQDIIRFKFHKEFQDRYKFINYAFVEYKAGRYYSCTPLLLMTIDGAVNDAIRKGFHAENIDLSSWDAVTSVDDGIGIIKNIFQKSRKKTSIEEITFPYRNGILHGRDLGYDNYKVAAKAWCFLFVVKDWIISKRTEEIRKEKHLKETSTPSWKELITQIQNTENYKQKVAEWKPRKIDKNHIDAINNGVEIDKTNPEYVVTEYLNLWKSKNYGKMAMLYASLITDNPKKYAKEVRETYGSLFLEKFEIIEINDDASAITEITVRIELKENDTKQCHFRLIYEDGKGGSLPRNMSGGNWKIIWNNIKEI